MRQKLFTSLIEKRLQKQYDLGSNLKSQVVVAKIFNPYGNQTWYLLNQDPEDTDYIWAIVDMGNGIDIGSVSKSELEKIRVRPFMLPLERDMYFKEVNAEELYKGLLKGEHYAKGGIIKAIKRIWKKINGTWHYNEGAGWKRDREFHNKSESYEKPNRKNYRNSKKSSK